MSKIPTRRPLSNRKPQTAGAASKVKTRTAAGAGKSASALRVLKGKPRIWNGEPAPGALTAEDDDDTRALAGSGGPETSVAPDGAAKPAGPRAFGVRNRGRPLKLLCVHGIGHQEADPNFQSSWRAAIGQAVGSIDPQCEYAIDFFQFDDLIDKSSASGLAYTAAFLRLLSSFVVNGVGDELRSARGFGDVPEVFKRTVVMVAKWVANDDLRATLRAEFAMAVGASEYDAVLAHSLGSLICYDTLAHQPDLLNKGTLVTFGSQIGHPAIRDLFAGRIQMPDLGRWTHLYNPDDHVLTAPIRIIDEKFKQIDEPFDIPNDLLNHDATWYLSHRNTVDSVWRALVGAEDSASRALVATAKFKTELHRPNKRALLIGINDYPDPANRLEGCVNDVFAMSALLQDSTFEPDEIRIVLNERATRSAILDRLHWLLDGVKKGDQRFLFYSGHGAQIPGYDAQGKPDHIDECLVPYDFDWSLDHAIIDKQFCELYSQLPYDSWFVAVFDCCHSGGMSRAGGPLVRGLSPPDDIRHRALQWDQTLRMWVPRPFEPLNKSLFASRQGQAYLGQNGAVRRLGRASTLRTFDNRVFDRTCGALRHEGPFLPILMEACGEEQLSYEYRDGGASYGAYTFCLTRTLAENRIQKRNLTFAKLHETVSAKLKTLKYGQTPGLLGAKDLLGEQIPWTRSQSEKLKGGT